MFELVHSYICGLSKMSLFMQPIDQCKNRAVSGTIAAVAGAIAGGYGYGWFPF